MIVELISVGTELLLGNIVNTNTQYLAEQCAKLGLSMYHQVTVGDNRERLKDAFQIALKRSDVVILTGGLGPTEDDLTKEVCAEVLDCSLEKDAHTKDRIKQYFENSIYKEIPENNWKQAMVPHGAKVLDNDNGTAPGIIMEKDGKAAILLPGPPNELEPLFRDQVFPFLKEKQPEVIRSQMIKICGHGESQVEDKLLDLINGQTNPTIATYAKTAEVHLRVTAKAKNEEEAKNLLKPLVKEIKSRFGDDIYTTKEVDSLEMTLVRLLKKYNLTVTTAESCTGGLIAGRLVNVSGASEVFREGFITYSNKSKRKLLGVSKSTLKKHGAVSVQTAKEMATGGVFATDADACLAVTGIAGPESEGEKPVGLVYIACYMKDKVKVEEFLFKGDRQKIREQTVIKALDLLRRSILLNYHS
ncbi:competence/damage-inducible protein A [Clostridium sp. E02]|uniref:competence/damage-inducible protein A n=1 Tax=Clostridium sp. E02 TaxID=2487134 RepID=UPI000F530292|nr:competence/damage-inducible protein A [Clostridium sp. E02]